jgi:hypothetical protein
MTDTPTTTDDKPAESDLGDAGKAALTAERKARAEAERQAQEARARADKLERAELVRTVAAEKGLTDSQASFLTGESHEELSTQADQLLEAFKTSEETPTPRRPREHLRPGAAPGAEAPDIQKLADRVLSN